MAYLRKETEAVEISYPLDRVWKAIQKVLANFRWNVQELNEAKRQIKVKTDGGFLSWASILVIDVESRDGNRTKLTIVAETPVTTITSMVDFGRAKQRISMFLRALAEELNR